MTQTFDVRGPWCPFVMLLVPCKHPENVGKECPEAKKCLSSEGFGVGITAKKLKVVWSGFHHNFEIIAPPTCADDVLVVHVTDESAHSLLKSDLNQAKQIIEEKLEECPDAAVGEYNALVGILRKIEAHEEKSGHQDTIQEAIEKEITRGNCDTCPQRYREPGGVDFYCGVTEEKIGSGDEYCAIEIL